MFNKKFFYSIGKFLLVSYFTFCFVVAVLFLLVYEEAGKRPDRADRERFKKEKNYNSQKEIFENRLPNILAEDQKHFAEEFKLTDLIGFFFPDGEQVPKEKLPEVKPKVEEFVKSSKELKVIWFGHATFLLNMDGNLILVDPVFSSSASPIKNLVNRFQPSILKQEEIPELDYIVITHDHYDHLDLPTIKFFLQARGVRFITPLGVGSHIVEWGANPERVVELGWWQEFSKDNISFTSTPAQHFSGRHPFHQNDTLWSSWVIKSKNYNIYLSGDSGYDLHFKEIGERLGPFDVAFIDSGQYHELWPAVHMFPKDVLIAFKDLKAEKLFPINWAMFSLAPHPWYDPAEQFYLFSKEAEIPLIIPKIGEVVNIKQEFILNRWWGKFISQIN